MPNEAYKKLRELLIQTRKRAELTQAELANRLKRPQSFVSKYERGARGLDVVEFREVAYRLDEIQHTVSYLGNNRSASLRWLVSEYLP